MKIKNLTDSLKFIVKSIRDNWNGSMTALDASDIADKNIIKNVVNSQPDLLKREQEIRNMTVIYKEIEDDILPPLRRAEVTINFYELKKTDEEMARLAVTYPDSLTNAELLYAATLTVELPTQLKIYKSAMMVYPENWKGYNNAGNIYLELDNIDEAAICFQKANTLSPNKGVILNNLGVIESKREDYNAAKSYYNAAKAQQRITANYNMGIVAITKGKYNEALSLFSGEKCRYNVALVKVLTGDLSGASTNLECAPQTAEVYYLTAVVGARSGNNAMVYENLKKAIKADASYRNIAKDDREFIKYFDNVDFLDALK